MPFLPGTTLGPYSVTAKIGEGGMGEVYQARDTKLDRDVALKVLPEAFTSDPDRLARFEREAKVLASLNHPNIGSIYGLEEAEGTKALVLELIDGSTLADRISQGPIPIDEALPIAKQIAEALEAAHEAGVIHRDLKPANIKVRADGTVKVLDFGLAKALAGDDVGADLSQSPTVTATGTREGVILGTAAYMSPEQARGKPLDKRTDIWSFGCVLFEMLTGKAAFAGETLSDTIGRVMEREPDWEALSPKAGPPVQRILRRCLSKERRERFHDIADVRLALQDAVEMKAIKAELATPGTSRQHVLPLALAVSAVAALASGFAVWSITRPAPLRVTRVALAPDDGRMLHIAGASPDLALSPDGSRVAYLTGNGGEVGAEQLHVRLLDQLSSETLVSQGELQSPFFSPDGQSIGFYDRSTTPNTLKRVSVAGGAATTICDLPESTLAGASWADDDTIVFSAGNFSVTSPVSPALWRVAGRGGEPVRLTTPDPERGELGHAWPEFLPGNEAVLFTIMADPIEESSIAAVMLGTGEQKVVLRGGFFPRYSPTGHLVYGRPGNLWAIPFDLGELETTGGPVLVQQGVVTKPLGSANFSVSGDGSLLYLPGDAQNATPGVPATYQAGARTLVWVDRDGEAAPVPGAENGEYRNPALSPSGRYVAYDDGEDIWTLDLTRESVNQVTTHAAIDSHPVWMSEDQIVFSSARADGRAGLYVRASDGTGDAEPLLLSEGTQPTGWAGGLGAVVFHQRSFQASETGFNRDVGLLSVPPGEPQMLFESELDAAWGTVSPNGQWIAYTAAQSGTLEVLIERFPTGGGRRKISNAGGDFPRWSSDGSELFYRSTGPSFQFWRASIGYDDGLTAGVPERLFSNTQYLNQPGNRMYDVAPAGDRFLVSAMTGGARSNQMVLVLDWFSELTELVPSP